MTNPTPESLTDPTWVAGPTWVADPTWLDGLASLKKRFPNLQWDTLPEWYDAYIGTRPSGGAQADLIVRIQEEDDDVWVATLFAEARDWSCDEDIGRGATPIIAMVRLREAILEKYMTVGLADESSKPRQYVADSEDALNAALSATQEMECAA